MGSKTPRIAGLRFWVINGVRRQGEAPLRGFGRGLTPDTHNSDMHPPRSDLTNPVNLDRICPVNGERRSLAHRKYVHQFTMHLFLNYSEACSLD